MDTNNELLKNISQIVKDEISQVKDEMSQIVKDEISQVRDEVSMLERKMDKRFDKVEERLDILTLNLDDAFKDIAISQERIEEHVAMYHVRGTVMKTI